MAAETTPVDLLVIGGGITGAGIALDAAARGLKAVLIEKGDFAAGTSSRSSKQIHGGLRYLEHFSLGLMREAISERHTLARLAPGLVHWKPFLLPYYQHKSKNWKYPVGLWLYDHLAKTQVDLRHRSLGSREVLQSCSGLRNEGLSGGALFFDCVTDDARLVLSVVLDAQVRGAKAYNYVSAESLLHQNKRVAGAVVTDQITGKSWEIRAHQVVCATGPWTDLAFSKFARSETALVRPAKGVHIVLARDALNVDKTILIPSAHDRRFLFVIPWYEGIVVGTTDTDYNGNPDAVRPDRSDVEYILDALNWTFFDARLSHQDIVSSYAGVRPLVNVAGKNTADVPREYRISESDDGLISIVGGKLTTYRLMARQVVDRVIQSFKARRREVVVVPCWTHRIPLGNPPEESFSPFKRIELPEDVRRHLLDDYGSWALQIVSIIEKFPQWSRRMSEGLPYILAEAFFAVTHEKARTLEDVLARRTRVALLGADQGRQCAREVCEIMAQELKWSPREIQSQLDLYESALRTKFPGSHGLS